MDHGMATMVVRFQKTSLKPRSLLGRPKRGVAEAAKYCCKLGSAWSKNAALALRERSMIRSKALAAHRSFGISLQMHAYRPRDRERNAAEADECNAEFIFAQQQPRDANEPKRTLVWIGRSLWPVRTRRIFLEIELGQLPSRRKFIGKPARHPLLIVTTTLRTSFPSGMMVTD
jgi:hypothetical protein